MRGGGGGGNGGLDGGGFSLPCHMSISKSASVTL